MICITELGENVENCPFDEEDREGERGKEEERDRERVIHVEGKALCVCASHSRTHPYYFMAVKVCFDDHSQLHTRIFV